jgi:hypothetical protein
MSGLDGGSGSNSTDGWVWKNVIEITGQDASPIGLGSGIGTAYASAGPTTLNLSIGGTPTGSSLMLAVLHQDNATVNCTLSGYTQLQHDEPGWGATTASWIGVASTAQTDSTVSWTGCASAAALSGAALELKAPAASGQTWNGNVATIAVTGISGSWILGAPPQTWTGNVATIAVTGVPGIFVGEERWIGSVGTIAVTGVSGAWSVGGGPQTWIGSVGTIAVTGVPGTWSLGAPPQTWTSGIATIAVTGISGAWATSSQLFPTAISGIRFLDQLGDPWIGVGDTGWSAFNSLNLADTKFYLDHIAALGVNTTIQMTPDPVYSSHSPNNQAGQSAWTGAPFQSSLNPAFWDDVATKMAYAQSLGITVLYFPAFYGFSDAEGWGAQFRAASTTQLQTYGADVATRLQSYPNIIWVLGGDKNFDGQQTRYEALAAGLKSVGPTKLMTYQAGRDVSAFAIVGSSSFINFNLCYSTGLDMTDDAQAVAAQWVAPVLMIEARYENEAASVGLTWRKQMYAAGFGGCLAGFCFGNNPRWGPDANIGAFADVPSSDWKSTLTTPSPGTAMLQKCAAFFSTNHRNLVGVTPDSGDLFLTGGENTGNNRAAAAFGTTAGYVYVATTGSITVNTTRITTPPTVRLRWFDPISGAYTLVSSPEAKTTARVVAHPGANSVGDSDWVLVVDNDDPVVADAFHAVTSDTVVLGQTQTITVANALHAVTSDIVLLGQLQILVVADGIHAVTSTTVALTQVQLLVVASSFHAVTSDTLPPLSIGLVLVVNDSLHGLTSSTVTLLLPTTLVVAAARHAQAATTVVLEVSLFTTMHVGAVELSGMYLGTAPVVAAFVGTVQVWGIGV